MTNIQILYKSCVHVFPHGCLKQRATLGSFSLRVGRSVQSYYTEFAFERRGNKYAPVRMGGDQVYR